LLGYTQSNMRWTENVQSMREEWNAYKVLVGKCERKGPVRRPRLTLKMVITDVKEVEWEIRWMWLTRGSSYELFWTRQWMPCFLIIWTNIGFSRTPFPWVR
jgi:hypothetical protein